MEQYLTLTELSTELRISRITLGRLSREGKIPGAFRVGRSWRYSVPMLRRWMEVADNQ